MTRALAIRGLVAAALVVAMSAFGVGVYHAAGYLKASRPQVERPTQTSGPSLPGTIFVVQGGAIYRFSQGKFTQVTSEAGWMQPAADPGGSRLVAVRRSANVSDLFILQLSGRPAAALTHNGSPTIESNHWAFYPRFSPDGSQIFYDFDPKDPYNSYRVDLAIFASPAGGGAGSVQWTFPNQYTGGDVNPVPLSGGGLIYTRFSIDDQSKVHSQLWFQARPGSPGTPPRGVAVVLARWQDHRLPGALDAGRCLPALDRERGAIDGALPDGDLLLAGPRCGVGPSLDQLEARL